ncbi:MAG: HAMP domain-containing histidine kinase [Clostridia bacterium]|nr:HAMP domain-containing histidine kinase [Clostridia bacterium]
MSIELVLCICILIVASITLIYTLVSDIIARRDLSAVHHLIRRFSDRDEDVVYRFYRQQTMHTNDRISFSDSDYRIVDTYKAVRELCAEVDILSHKVDEIRYTVDRSIRIGDGNIAEYLSNAIERTLCVEELTEAITNRILGNLKNANVCELNKMNDAEKKDSDLSVLDDYYLNRVQDTRRVVYNILHLLNTPLSGIKANLQIIALTNKSYDDRDLEGRLDSILSAVEMIESSMNALLENGNIEETDNVKSKLIKMAKTILLVSTKKINIKADSIPEDWSLPQSTFDSLIVCALCIIENAAYFSPDNGDIIMEYEADDAIQKLMITNTGNHIDDAVGERIFDYGYSTKDDGKGLGLFITKKVAKEQLSGDVKYENLIIEGQSKVSFIISFEVNK